MFLTGDASIQGFRIITYFLISFALAIAFAPLLIEVLNKLRWWKKKSKSIASTGEKLEVVKKFAEQVEGDRKVPVSGGILIWGTTLLVAGIFFLLLRLFPDTSGIPGNKTFFEFLNFVDLRQTFIPLGVLVGGAILGFIDDFLETREHGGNYKAGGLKLSQRMIGVILMSVFIGWWFHARIGDIMHKITLPWWDSSARNWFVLDLNSIQLPLGWLDRFLNGFGLDWNLVSGGWLIIPITVIVLVLLWASAIIDGFDGLSTGTLIPIYICFMGLAFVSGFYNIAALVAVMSGAMVAYLWYNIPPAQFFLGDTGSTPLLLLLATVAMLIDRLYVLPLASFLLLLTVFSSAIQVLSKKIFKRKVFLAAPFHHHLEAKGWLRHQVTMRYWLVSLVCSMLAFAIGIIIL